MTDIFISYSHIDKPWVSVLAKALESLSYNIWWSADTLHEKDFEASINSVLSEAKCVLTVWSEASIESRWVRDESNFALQRNIFIPVLYQTVPLPAPFQNIRTGNLTSWNGNLNDPQFQKLVSAIEQKCPSNKANPPKTSKQKHWKKWAALTAIGSIMALGGHQVINNKISIDSFTNLNWINISNSSKEPGAEILESYKKAANQGYARAQHSLAWMYRHGKGGLEQSDTKAMEWYKKAAEGGHAQAQYNLGMMYLNGQGEVKQPDKAKALKWIRKSARKGNQVAKDALYIPPSSIDEFFQHKLHPITRHGHAEVPGCKPAIQHDHHFFELDHTHEGC